MIGLVYAIFKRGVAPLCLGCPATSKPLSFIYIDRLILVLEKVSNFHQGYVSNAYPCLQVDKEQIFISSAFGFGVDWIKNVIVMATKRSH